MVHVFFKEAKNIKRNLLLTIVAIALVFFIGKILPYLLPVALFLIKLGIAYMVIVFGITFLKRLKQRKTEDRTVC